jgi:hypothetical protein
MTTACKALKPTYRRISDDGLGQRRLRTYLVARRHNLLGSPEWQLLGSISLFEARRRYEAGTHLLVQARDGDWTLQYLIPRKERSLLGARDKLS